MNRIRRGLLGSLLLSVASRKTIVRILESQFAASPTPSPTPMTDRLAAWLEELDRQPPPIPASHYAGLHAALSDSRRSLREIADQLQGSPTLALSILREANRAESARDNPAESLEVALSRLGLSAREPTSEDPAEHPGCGDAQGPRADAADQPARHAAGQRPVRRAPGQALAGNPLGQPADHGSGLGAGQRPPAVAGAMAATRAGTGEPTLRVERELLGMRLLPICLALAERWRLPQWVIQGYRLLACDRRLLVRAPRIARDHQSPLLQQQQLDAQPDLARWLTQPANCTLLANGLAIAAHQSWDGRMLRWQRLTGLYLGQPPDRSPAAGAHARRAKRAPARPTAAVASGGGLDLALAGQPLACRSGAPPPPSAEALAEWRQHCAELLREPSPFSNVVQLTACARDALRACGLQGCCCWWPIAPRYTCWRSRAPDSNGPGEIATGDCQRPAAEETVQQPALLRIGPNNQDQLLPASANPCANCSPGLTCCCARWATARGW